MAIGVYFHPKSLSAAQYDKANSDLDTAGAGHPAGRMHHSCFGPDTDLMVYEIWDSQQAFEDYGKTLMPVLQNLGINPGTPDVMPLHNLVV